MQVFDQGGSSSVACTRCRIASSKSGLAAGRSSAARATRMLGPGRWTRSPGRPTPIVERGAVLVCSARVPPSQYQPRASAGLVHLPAAGRTLVSSRTRARARWTALTGAKRIPVDPPSERRRRHVLRRLVGTHDAAARSRRRSRRLPPHPGPLLCPGLAWDLVPAPRRSSSSSFRKPAETAPGPSRPGSGGRQPCPHTRSAAGSAVGPEPLISSRLVQRAPQRDRSPFAAVSAPRCNFAARYRRVDTARARAEQDARERPRFLESRQQRRQRPSLVGTTSAGTGNHKADSVGSRHAGGRYLILERAGEARAPVDERPRAPACRRFTADRFAWSVRGPSGTVPAPSVEPPQPIHLGLGLGLAHGRWISDSVGPRCCWTHPWEDA